MPYKLLSLLLGALLLSHSALAFGPRGHQVVAQIALLNVEASTLEQLEQILQGKTLMQLSTWPDQIRRQKQWRHTGPWHYINIPEGKSLEQIKRSSKGDVLARLEHYEQQLQNRDQLKTHQRWQTLAFYVHFTGDIHQPLHVGYGEDRGGNQVEVSIYGRSSNLHRVWDGQLLPRQPSDTANYANQLLDSYASKQALWQGQDYRQWLEDSRSLLPQVYDFTGSNIDSSYIQRNQPLLEQQLVKAGLRLAESLDRILSPQ